MIAKRKYIDFKLYLTCASENQGVCQVSLLPAPEVGESVTPMVVASEERPPEDLLALLANKNITLRDLITVGKKLANCLIPKGTICDRFQYAYSHAGTDGGVRLRIIIADQKLKQLPWEYAFFNFLDGPDSMAGFLALNPRISIVRHEPLPFPHPVQKKSANDISELRMAILAALPEGQSKLDLKKEVENIKQAVHDFDVEGVHLTVDPVIMDATPQDLSRLPKGTFLFHFAGHGITETKIDRSQRGGFTKPEGAILLVGDKITRSEAILRAGDLAAILQQAGVRLAVMGACNSGARDARYPWDGVAGALAASEIRAIIAMQYEVNDKEAIAFGEAFYGGLASGLSLDEAMFVGRRAMLLDTVTDPSPNQAVTVEWGVPVLYSRLPDGSVFPERMQHPGSTAANFRKVISQSVDLINKSGKVTGIKANRVKGGFSVTQVVEVVDGELLGAENGEAKDNASINISQDIGTVSGSVTGVDNDEI